MKLLYYFLDVLRSRTRAIMHVIAVGLNHATRGHVSPNAITIVGLLMHVPIAWLIAGGSNYWAAGLLVIFGLFDTLDGELARLQKSASSTGMLLDASTD
ncbi:MAG TPA: CDP-alcohol phosphatidyltransferase family protein, partial [Hymenobacter sp.]